MRNGFAALVGLVVLGVCAPAQQSGFETEVAVYLKSSGEQPAAIVRLFQREAQSLLRPAGVRLVWRDWQDVNRHEDFQAVVVAQFSGVCSPARDSEEPAAWRLAPLAATPVQDGAILPFTQVNCDAVRRLTSPLMSGEPGARRTYLFGRALGRVLAHELYHILGQTKLHADKGIAKPAFHARELLSESFAFHEPAILVMRTVTGEPVAPQTEVAGR